MAIKTFKPTTPSRRNMTVSGFDGVDKKAKPERSLVEPLKKHRPFLPQLEKNLHWLDAEFAKLTEYQQKRNNTSK